VESRYDAIGSLGRTAPKSEDMITSHLVARRREAASSDETSRASYSTPV
jgi:hypothetical protein